METLLAKTLRGDPDKSAKLLAELQKKIVELEERLKRIEELFKSR